MYATSFCLKYLSAHEKSSSGRFSLGALKATSWSSKIVGPFGALRNTPSLHSTSICPPPRLELIAPNQKKGRLPPFWSSDGDLSIFPWYNAPLSEIRVIFLSSTTKFLERGPQAFSSQVMVTSVYVLMVILGVLLPFREKTLLLRAHQKMVILLVSTSLRSARLPCAWVPCGYTRHPRRPTQLRSHLGSM